MAGELNRESTRQQANSKLALLSNGVVNMDSGKRVPFPLALPWARYIHDSII